MKILDNPISTLKQYYVIHGFTFTNNKNNFSKKNSTWITYHHFFTNNKIIHIYIWLQTKTQLFGFFNYTLKSQYVDTFLSFIEMNNNIYIVHTRYNRLLCIDFNNQIYSIKIIKDNFPELIQRMEAAMYLNKL